MPRKPTRTTTRTDPRDPRSKRKPDAAEKVARLTYVEGTITDSVLRFRLARRIRSAIRREVKAERERCLSAIDRHTTEAPWTDAEIVAKSIRRTIRKGTP